MTDVGDHVPGEIAAPGLTPDDVAEIENITRKSRALLMVFAVLLAVPLVLGLVAASLGPQSQ